jgi:hypothetical protein
MALMFIMKLFGTLTMTLIYFELISTFCNHRFGFCNDFFGVSLLGENRSIIVKKDVAIYIR